MTRSGHSVSEVFSRGAPGRNVSDDAVADVGAAAPGSGVLVTHPPRLRRLAAGALSLCLAGTVLSTVAAGTAQGAQAPTVRVHITKYHNVKMPTRLRPGMHRFVVRSTKDAGFELVRPHAGYTKREFSHDIRVGFRGDVAAFKRFERSTDLLGGVNPQGRGPAEVMWVRVPRGRVWALDASPDRVPPRKVLTLHVAGARVPGVLPGRATLRAIHETDFAKRPRSIPGSGRLIVRNNSTDNHFFGIVRLRAGKTVADFAEWIDQVKQGNDAPPPVNFDVGGVDSGVVGPGHAMSLKYGLPAGDYVLVCFWPDVEEDFMPHAFMGMYRGLRVR